MWKVDRDSLPMTRVVPDPENDYAGYWHTTWTWYSTIKRDIPEPICSDTVGAEYRFAKESHDREWRFDWCIPEYRVAVEVDGGKMLVRRTRKGQLVPVGRHNQDSDLWKLNTAASMSWLVFNFSLQMIKEDPDRAVGMVQDALILRMNDDR